MIFKLKIFCIIICICMTASTFTGTIPVKAAESGNTYYVSTDGSDTNSGSIEQPWASLVFAANTLQPGDTLNIRGGTYLSNQLTITKSGTMQLPITIKAYSDGVSPPELPIIDMENAGGNPDGAGIFFVDGTSNIILDGLSVLSTRGTIRAIDLMTYPFPSNYNVHNNVIIRNCTTKDTNCAVGIGSSSGISIENCSFYDNGGNLVYISGVQDGQGDGDHVTIINSEKVIVKNCYFEKAGHYSVTAGLWTRDAANPLVCKDIIVENNIIEQHWGGGIGILNGTINSVVQDNDIRYIGEALLNFPKKGIQIWGGPNIFRRNIIMKSSAYKEGSQRTDPALALDCSGVDQEVSNRIYNNIFYKSGCEGIRIMQRDNGIINDNKILNNIMYKNRVGGPEKLPWLPGALKDEDMWFNISVEAMTTQGTTAWSTGNANNNQFYNNDFLPYADNRDYPGYSKAIWISLKTSDKFYSIDGISAKFPTAFYKNIEENPMFVNEGFTNNEVADDSLCDFNLKADSPCIDSGAHLTKTVETGTSTTQLNVEDSRFFTDGCGMMPGDKIKIGDREPISAIEIDYTNNVITLASPVTYTTGENVDLPYNGTAPDMGVYESPYSITRTPTPAPTTMPTATAPVTAAATATPTLEPASTPNNEFVDVNIETISWAADQIKELATTGIIKGYSEDGQWLFKPNNSITRAEYATLLVKAFNLQDETAVSNFTDVVSGHWAYPYVAAASKLGIVKGISATEFAPDINITRQDMAVILSRMLNLSTAESEERLSIFSDKSLIADYAEVPVAACVEADLIHGYPDGTFGPLGNATRAEAAVLTDNVYRFVNNKFGSSM